MIVEECIKSRIKKYQSKSESYKTALKRDLNNPSLYKVIERNKRITNKG